MSYWQLTALGAACEVAPPSPVPGRAGDRVRTDRREAAKLARSYRAGERTPVWMPDAAHEALRDLVRARQDPRQDQLRARCPLSRFLLRHGRRPPADVRQPWTLKFVTWVQAKVHFQQSALEDALLDYVREVELMAQRTDGLEKAITGAIQRTPQQMQAVTEALQALRGVAQIRAVTVPAEPDPLSRFRSAHHLMA